MLPCHRFVPHNSQTDRLAAIRRHGLAELPNNFACTDGFGGEDRSKPPVDVNTLVKNGVRHTSGKYVRAHRVRD